MHHHSQATREVTPSFGTFSLAQRLHPPCPQHQEVVPGSRSLMWPPIQACSHTPGYSRDPMEKQRAGRLHPWAQLWPPTGSVWPAETTIRGKCVEKGCTAHIPQGILFCTDFGGCHKGNLSRGGDRSHSWLQQSTGWGAVGQTREPQTLGQSQAKPFGRLENELRSPAGSWGCCQHQR